MRAEGTTNQRFVALVGLAVSGVFLWLAFRNLSYSLIRDALSRAELWPWTPLAMLAYLAGHGVRGLRLRKLVSAETDLPLGTATNIVVLGYAVNNVLPARMGEVARAALLSDRLGMPFTQSLTVTAVERLLDGWTTLFFLCAGIALTPGADASLLRTAYVAATVFGTVTLTMLLVGAFPSSMASIASRIAGSLNRQWQEPAHRHALHVASALDYLRRPWLLRRLVLLSIAVWTLETLMFVAMLPAFGLAARFDWGLLALGSTNLGTAVPSTPGFIGHYHYFCMETLVMLGVPRVVASTYAITVHAVFYVPITLWGVGVLMRYGIELGRVAAEARDAKKRTDTTEIEGVPMVVLASRKVTPGSDEPGSLVYALTEALAPTTDDAAFARSPEVTRKVATFVQGQLNALPGALGLLMRIGLFGFRVLVRLRYLRGFCDLPLEKRRSVAHAWAYGPYALTRALFRAIRSLTLFRYYEEVDKAVPAAGVHRLEVLR